MSQDSSRDTYAKIRVVTVVTALAVSAFVLFGPKMIHASKSASTEVSDSSSRIFVPGANSGSPSQSSSQSSSQLAPQPTNAPASPSSRPASPSTRIETPSPALQGPATEHEKSSLASLSSVLFEETRGSGRPIELIQKLKSLGVRPMVATDSNESTGSMVVVRTENALPGTRYFHAQFFTDESGRFYPQHVSFEFRPSDSMADVVSSLERSFGRLGRPSTNDGTWMIWKLPNDYTLWIKRLEKSDLETNSYNAYSPKDLNTIRVAIEKDVPGHEDEDAPN